MSSQIGLPGGPVETPLVVHGVPDVARCLGDVLGVANEGDERHAAPGQAIGFTLGNLSSGNGAKFGFASQSFMRSRTSFAVPFGSTGSRLTERNPRTVWSNTRSISPAPSRPFRMKPAARASSARHSTRS